MQLSPERKLRRRDAEVNAIPQASNGPMLPAEPQLASVCGLSPHRVVRPVDALAQTRERELRTLMAATLDGDARAYHTLLEELTRRLRAYYRRRFAMIGQGPTEAEDLLQEVLLALHTQRHTYDGSQPFTPWLYAIARYKFVDHLRRTRTKIRDTTVESAAELTAHSDIAAVETALDLERLMSRIPFAARQVIRYVKLEGLSVSEAAARCGKSESAVKVAVHRGLKALASRMGE